MASVERRGRIARDRTEELRLESLRACAQEMRSKMRLLANVTPICQPVKVWAVSPEKRTVVEENVTLTYAAALGPNVVHFLQSRPTPNAHAVVEVLQHDGSVVSRFLVHIREIEPAIRGYYAARADILSAVPTAPVGVIFNRGYFNQ